MKKVFAGITIAVLWFLFVATFDYSLVQFNQSAFSLERYQSQNDHQRYSLPQIDANKKEKFISFLDRFAKENQVTFSYSPNQLRAYGIDRNSVNTAFLTTYRKDRLARIPFEEEITVSEFNQGKRLFYSRQKEGLKTDRLKSFSKKVGLFLGNMNALEESFSGGQFYIGDANPSLKAKFAEELSNELGISPQPEDDVIDWPPNTWANFKKMIQISFKAKEVLFISVALLSMLLVYLNQKKNYSIPKLMGYGPISIFGLLLKTFLVPTVVIVIITLIPFTLLRGGVIPQAIISMAPVYGLLIIVFLALQTLFCFLMTIDVYFQDIVGILKNEKSNKFILALGILMKSFSVFLIIPILVQSVSSYKEIKDYWQFQKQIETNYKNVWVLNLSNGSIQTDTMDSSGNFLDSQDSQDPQKLSWIKEFYDRVADDYPMFFIRPGGEEDYDRHTFHVSGNFVNLMNLTDEQGQPIKISNYEPIVISSSKFSKETLERLDNRRNILSYFWPYTSEKGKPVTSNLEEAESFEPGPRSGPEENNNKPTFNFKHITAAPNSVIDTFAMTKDNLVYGKTKDFILVANGESIGAAITPQDFYFLNPSEVQRQEILGKVKDMAFSNQLRWRRVVDENVENREPEVAMQKDLMKSLAISLLAMVSLTIFVYWLLLNWLSRNFAIQLLFGQAYWQSGLSLFFSQLLIVFTIFFSQTKEMITSHGMNTVIIVGSILLCLEALLFTIIQWIFSRNVLRDLKTRE